MKKKLLEKVPMKMISQFLRTKETENIKYTVCAEIIMTGEEKILMIDFYETDPIVPREMQFTTFRLFISESEDFMYEPHSKKWFQKKIETLPGVSSWYGYERRFEMMNNESLKAIEEFIPDKGWKNSWADKIRYRQEEYRSNKANKVYQARVNRINRKNEYIDTLTIPDDFMEFVDDSFCDLRYAFYKAKGKKKVEVFCSHCKTKYEVSTSSDARPRHNEYSACPHCGSRIMYKSPGRAGRISETKEIILMLKTEDGFVSKYYDACRTSSEYGEDYHMKEKARVLYDKTRTWVFYNSNGYSEPQKISWWDRNGGTYNYKVSFGSGILYHANLDDVVRETPFRYCAIKLLAAHKPGYVIHHECFFAHFESARFVEYFIKMGLFNLANDYVRHHWTTKINAKGKNVNEILGISREQINRLILMDGNLYTLELMQMENTQWKRFEDDQLEYIGANGLTLLNLNEAMKHTTINRIIKYIDSKRNIETPNKALQYWVDYIANCKLLKYDLKNEFVLFPKQLKSAHDISAKEVVEMKNENRDKLFKELMDEAKEKYSFESKTFAIIAPGSVEDIKAEGHTLHHCVGTYVDRVLEGKTTILFIRRKDNLKKPFYTMEVNKGEIVQCRGEYNKDMTEPVKRFVDSFKKNRLILGLLKEAI